MAPSTEVGGVGLRTEVVDKVIKLFAEPSYKFKQALSTSTTNAWKNEFIREQTDVLTENDYNTGKGIPRGANFPQLVGEWEKVPSWLLKYGYEDNIMWEDILTNDVNVQDRTLFKLAQKVTEQVDAEIWDVLTESQALTGNIQRIVIDSLAHWTGSSAAIIDNLMRAKQLIEEADISTEGLICFTSPRDYRAVVKFVTDNGAQFDKLGDETARNGKVPGLAGVKFVVSNNVTASYALVVKPKIVGNWRQAVGLTTDVKKDPFKSARIRVVEMGTTELWTPKAAVMISNTQGRGVDT